MMNKDPKLPKAIVLDVPEDVEFRILGKYLQTRNDDMELKVLATRRRLLKELGLEDDIDGK